ncbi:hypothetical protein COT72_03920 [archaeon CG10_big_fil_rev_8_21_14_0_10_43_11]|nr:MAG: hypothetical protein COT72_03920 [archaeon CG10_big_fil_rev_8_21_14_0_10_43_11]
MKEISLRRQWVLAGTSIVILTLCALVLALTPSFTLTSSLRAVYGIPFILFLPGYSITRTFIQKIDKLETFVISVALSIASMTMLTFFTNYYLRIELSALNLLIQSVLIILFPLVFKKYESRFKNKILWKNKK